jgi:hypothetical protein
VLSGNNNTDLVRVTMLFSSQEMEKKLILSRRRACDSTAKHSLCLDLSTIAVRMRDDTEREGRSDGGV